MVDEGHDVGPTISWAEARKNIKKTVEDTPTEMQVEVTDYAKATGFAENMLEAAGQYAEWSGPLNSDCCRRRREGKEPGPDGH